MDFLFLKDFITADFSGWFTGFVKELLIKLFRVLIICLSGISIKYIIRLQLGMKIDESKENLAAMIMMIFSSIFITWLYFYDGNIKVAVWETVIFWLVSNILYVLLRDFYIRIDKYFDSKIGEN